MERETSGNRVRLGLVQMKISDDREENMARAADKTREAAGRGARIICLPELYRTPYFPQKERAEVHDLAEPIPGDSTRLFSEIARELAVVIILPLFERGPKGRFYNAAAVVDTTGELLETYRKIHLPQDPLFYEQNYFSPGDLGYRIYRTDVATFSVLICYDQWFPEAARICALAGAEILFYPTAIGRILDQPAADEDWPGAWETVQRSHAITNGVHVAAVNRCGREGRLAFWGGSFVCDAFGNLRARAGAGQEVLVVETDLSMNRRIRAGWGFHRNRRPDTYGPLTRKP